MRTSPTHRRTRSRRVRRFGALAALLASLLIGGAALAQDGQTGIVATEVLEGTQIVLPDGTRCLPLPEAERDDVAGAPLDHYCGDGTPRGLVGGVLESAGQVSLEVVDLSGGTSASDHTAGLSRLALFRVQLLVLDNGATCTFAPASAIPGDDRPVTYECVNEGQRSVVFGTIEKFPGVGPATHYVYVADVDLDGALMGEAEQVEVKVIDGSLPLTKTDWVLASWGTGQAPPIAGAAPTLSFGEGMINGHNGCNSFFASATILAEGQLLLGPAGATLMACEEALMQQEHRFMAALDGVSGYELIDGDLYLFGGAEVLRFTPAG